MGNIDQKRWERFHVDLFSRLQPAAIVYVPEHACPPAPDFLVSFPTKTLGIELTGFYLDATPFAGSLVRELHSLRQKVMELALRLWESRQDSIVQVNLTWDDHRTLLKSEAGALAEKLVDLVASQLPEMDSNRYITYPDPAWKKLPEHAVAISISRPHWLDRSIWSFSQGGVVPQLRDAFGQLQKILDAKESKVTGYRKHCAEVWLLIVADFTTIQSCLVIDEDEVASQDLISSFDAAYVLSVYSNRVIELSLSR